MGPKNFDLQSCVNISKEKPNKTKESLELTIVWSLPTLDHVDSGEISPTQFYIWQKTGCGMWYFLSFETENWICWLLRHYLNFLCELNFIGQQIFNLSP